VVLLLSLSDAVISESSPTIAVLESRGVMIGC
jgi:hypothetical protein